VAFKQMAMRYHPDVYSGPDADERIRKLIEAYQTLRDPEKRRAYDHKHHPLMEAAERQPGTNAPASEGVPEFIFPDLEGATGGGLVLRLQGARYTLSGSQVAHFMREGMLRGHDQPSGRQGTRHCHRCGRDWFARQGLAATECPSCHARDWHEYLLLYCGHCRAVFESEAVHQYQVREVNGQFQIDDHTCTPYEMYPLCPHCRAGGWCPAEERRLAQLREQRRLARRLAHVKIALALVALATATSATAYFLANGAHP
jgi:hypothetical protein